jgi:hypothetical protein
LWPIGIFQFLGPNRWFVPRTQKTIKEIGGRGSFFGVADGVTVVAGCGRKKWCDHFAYTKKAVFSA